MDHFRRKASFLTGPTLKTRDWAATVNTFKVLRTERLIPKFWSLRSHQSLPASRDGARVLAPQAEEAEGYTTLRRSISHLHWIRLAWLCRLRWILGKNWSFTSLVQETAQGKGKLFFEVSSIHFSKFRREIVWVRLYVRIQAVVRLRPAVAAGVEMPG